MFALQETQMYSDMKTKEQKGFRFTHGTISTLTYSKQSPLY